ncbi:MAG: outer membrane beta-barrel protein, partial [Roseomonas sp.]|nr:outer membrane beta-barrel protein [Roseomonas sp.]
MRKVLLAATMFALPLSAQAQPVSGLYVGAGIGLNTLMETDVDFNNRFMNPRTGTAEFEHGGVGVISLGWGFGNGLRAEIEGSYRSNDVDSLTGYGLTSPRTSGDVQSYGIMGNVFYDLDQGAGWPVIPYAGLGVGLVLQDYNRVRAMTASGDRVHVVGSQASVAYQAILGAALPLDVLATGLALTAEYRFMGTLGHEGDSSAARSFVGRAESGKAEWNNFNHSVLLGIRYAFNAAPPRWPPSWSAAASPAPPWWSRPSAKA